MANTNLPVGDSSRAGLNVGANGGLEVTCVPANHHTFKNDGKITVIARNNGATVRTVTLVLQETVDGQSATSRTVSLAATGSAGDAKEIGPFPPPKYNVPTGADEGLIYIDGDHADIKFQAKRVSPV